MSEEPDDAVWWLGCFYNNPADDRIWVSKRQPWMGWTLNFAKSESYAILAALLAAVAAGGLMKRRPR